MRAKGERCRSSRSNRSRGSIAPLCFSLSTTSTVTNHEHDNFACVVGLSAMDPSPRPSSTSESIQLADCSLTVTYRKRSPPPAANNAGRGPHWETPQRERRPPLEFSGILFLFGFFCLFLHLFFSYNLNRFGRLVGIWFIQDVDLVAFL